MADAIATGVTGVAKALLLLATESLFFGEKAVRKHNTPAVL
jgi:hypothetical protein